DQRLRGGPENVHGEAAREHGARRPGPALRALAVRRRTTVAAPRRARDEGADGDPGIRRSADVDRGRRRDGVPLAQPLRTSVQAAGRLAVQALYAVAQADARD